MIDEKEIREAFVRIFGTMSSHVSTATFRNDWERFEAGAKWASEHIKASGNKTEPSNWDKIVQETVKTQGELLESFAKVYMAQNGLSASEIELCCQQDFGKTTWWFQPKTRLDQPNSQS